MNSPIPPLSAAQPAGPVTNEIRFAVVMYGGVSLAIYMNGIAQELLRLVRSTARKGWDNSEESEFRFSDLELTGTELVYRQLSKALTHGKQSAGVRFIVDILSGTSAGGINGIFLAKALACGQSMDNLQDLWIKEGDLEKLLNDSGSTQGVNLPKPSRQKSLLNSDRMYYKLLEAFTGMDLPDDRTKVGRSGAADAAPSHSELVEELDLFVTTTDIRGRVIPLRTSDRLVYERRYKYAFHLKYVRAGSNPVTVEAPKEHNDFELNNNPFLAFAARCTSSFPFAFEPMCLNKIEQLVPSFPGYAYDPNTDVWKKFFPVGHSVELEKDEFKSRSFGDGGYLDNKPFDHAIDMLQKRSSDLPSQRKLLYIEPAPEHPELRNSKERKTDSAEPNALDNSLAALVTLPGYEPIREDLLRINQRNRVIRKVTELIDSISAQLATPAKSAEARTDQTVANLDGQRGAAYTAYALLRVHEVTDGLANVIAKILNYEREGSYFFAVRCIIRAWREMFYERRPRMPAPSTPAAATGAAEEKTLATFLAEFDLGYHVRRARFVRSQIDFLYSLEPRAIQHLQSMLLNPSDDLRTNPTGEYTTSFLKALREIKKPVDQYFRNVMTILRCLSENSKLSARLAGIDPDVLNEVLGVKQPTDKKRGPFAPNLQGSDGDREYTQHAHDLLARDGRLVFSINEIAAVIRANAQKAIPTGDVLENFRHTDAAGAAGLAYAAVCRFYDQFAEYDSALFPLIYGTDVGELDPVDIIRISPEDATCIVDELAHDVRKLKGIWMGHFGAFLDGRWRASDILWGRLDAAERLILSLLPGKEGERLVDEAHDAILQDLIKSCRVDVAEEVISAALERASGNSRGAS